MGIYVPRLNALVRLAAVPVPYMLLSRALTSELGTPQALSGRDDPLLRVECPGPAV